MDGQRMAHFLRSIPRSDEDALAIEALVSEDEVAICAGIALMLRLWGCVRYDAPSGEIQASSQTASYTLSSLAHYAENPTPIIEDWKQRGISQQYEDIFKNGASFLYALEHQRLIRNGDALPSRHERVAQVLITRHSAENGVEFLMQYDRNARQYQFIGGRAKDNEPDIMMTMMREIEEELVPLLVMGRDYKLVTLIDDLSLTPSLSPTFGALTAYRFTIYHMQALSVSLQLSDNDRWVPVEQIKRGVVVVDGQAYPFNNHDLYQALERHIAGGMVGLSNSLR